MKPILISGCPRSGTSAGMLVMQAGLGADRIYGEKFPMDKAQEALQQKGPKETKRQHEYRKFTMAVMDRGRTEEQIKQAHDMNPQGFWESPFTVRGLSWSVPLEDELAMLTGAASPMVMKVVSQGLALSDPSLVGKVVMMVRDPHSVAKSQERLQREFKFTSPVDGMTRDLFSGGTVHSPAMFIRVTTAAALWLRKHPEIEMHMVLFDDLIGDTRKTVEGIRDFLGEDGMDLDEAVAVINPDLNRSKKHEPKPSKLWDDAALVYEKFLNRDWEAIARFAEDQETETAREQKHWICTRLQRPMVEAHCANCKSNPKFAADLRKNAERRGIAWQGYPCAWDVAYDPNVKEGDRPTIDQSITDNHWVTEDDRKRLRFEKQKKEYEQKMKGLKPNNG